MFNCVTLQLISSRRWIDPAYAALAAGTDFGAYPFEKPA
jgi:hypothetical protein